MGELYSINDFRLSYMNIEQAINLVHKVQISNDGISTISICTIIQYSRDRYEIIRLLKLSHSIKQPCSSVCLKKALEMHQKCLNNAVPF